MIEFLGKNIIFTDVFLHQIQQDESLESIALQYNKPLDELKIQNGKQDFRVGKCLILLNNKNKYHIVKPCETYESIAMEHNISVEELKQKNRVNTLFIGQRLII